MATLAHLAGAALKASLWREQVNKEEWDAVNKKFDGLVAALSSIQMVLGKPPSMPPEWQEEMSTWLDENKPQVRKGHPINEYDRFLFPLLLGFFYVTFNRDPTASEGGSAERFVTEFFKRLRQAMMTAEWLIEHEEHRPDLRKLIMERTEEAVRSRIREYKKNTGKQKETLIDLLHVMKHMKVLVQGRNSGS